MSFDYATLSFFGTFPLFGLVVCVHRSPTAMPPSRGSVWVYWRDVVV
jgi:hypothetical protein